MSAIKEGLIGSDLRLTLRSRIARQRLRDCTMHKKMRSTISGGKLKSCIMTPI